MRRPGSCLVLLALAFGWVSLASANVLDDLEAGLGRPLARAVEQGQGVWRGPSTNALLSSIASDLFALRSRDFPYHVVLLNSFQINAYSLPGGHIFMLRGLLAHADSIDEIAGVLAHEMGHQEDADFRRLAVRQLLWLGLASAARHERGDGVANLTTGLGVLNMLRHSRQQEAEADTRSVKFCLETGYDPGGIGSFLARIKDTQTSYLATIFATHPSSTKRLATVSRRAAAGLADHPFQAWHVCLSLAARGRPVTAYRLAHRMAKQPAHRWWAEPEARRLQAVYDSARGVKVAMPRPTSPEKSLRAPLDAIRNDGRIRWALEVAQVVTPDPSDARYLSTLGLTLAAIDRLSRALDAGYEAWYRVSCAPDVASSSDREHFLASMKRLRRGGLMIASVLAELTGMGPQRPLGQIDSARTGLLWAEAQYAFNEIKAGQAGADALLETATSALARRNVDDLTRLSDVWPQVTDATLRAISGKPPEEALSSWRSRLEEASARAGNKPDGRSRSRAADAEDVYVVSRLALAQLAGETRGATAVAKAANH